MEFLFAVRNLSRRPFLNIIKSAGLGLSLTGILLILLYLNSELSFDRYHKNANRIFRLTVTNTANFDGKHFARVYSPDYIPAMANYFPEIESYVRLVPVRGSVMKLNENFIRINEAFQCDSTFFRVFDVEMLTGNPDKILDNPATMVVSESFARRVFGKQNPVGKTLTLPSGQFYGKETDFTIRGVMKDFPHNSHFHPEFIASPESKDEFKEWAWTYFLLHRGSNPAEIVNGFGKFYSKHFSAKDISVEAHLQSIKQIHLYSDKLREIEPNGNLFVIITLFVAALILLFISHINYINLNMGMAAFSDKYVHISKVFGASGYTALRYYMAEGLIIVALSIAMSAAFLAIAHILLLKYFALNLLKGNTSFTLTVIAAFGILGIGSGLLPQFYRKGMSKGLIVIQYTMSTALIIAVIVMIRQMNFALKNSMGEDRGELICLEDLHSDVQSKFSLFKQELLKYQSVRSVTAMLDPPGGEANDMFPFEAEGYRINEKENDNMIGILPCDYSFNDVFGLKLLAGRDFSPVNDDNAGSGEYIVNKSAVKRLGYTLPETAVGKTFKLIFEEGEIKIPSGSIIGVVDDFHLSGIKKQVEPLVLFKRKDIWLINFVVAAEPGMSDQALTDIEKVWKKMYPEQPFGYRLVNTIYRHVYKAEIIQTRLLYIFTIISVFISSIGLLGLSLLTSQRRTKEIGIRVVNGASIGEILTMLNWYFIRWILISFIIAIPLAWYGMYKWLEIFAYKTKPEAWIFGLAGLITVVIALVTVSLQSWKAATRNPIESLHYE
jgi:putative ABC transport system permease protein